MATEETRAHAAVSPTWAIADTRPQTAEGKVLWHFTMSLPPTSAANSSSAD